MEELAASAWPTPRARDGKSGEASDATFEKNARPLNESATRWPTPNAADGERDSDRMMRGNPTLAGAARASTSSRPDPPMLTAGDESSPSDQTSRPLWKTMTTSDSSGHGYAYQSGKHERPVETLVGQARTLTGKKRLNPEFVRWLMGFPEGWLDIE